MTHVVQVASVGSTQDEVRMRLDDAPAGEVVAVRALDQTEGRGREGRRWQTPQGDGLLLSIGVRGPLPVEVLDGLPADVAALVRDAVTPAESVAWKAPNDLVAAATGAKVAGVLVDVRTTGDTVDELIVGIGCNLTGEAFTTEDGRAATSLAALDAQLDVSRLVAAVAQRLTASG